MSKFEKAGLVTKQAARPEDMERINRFTLRELSEDEVFAFRIAACNDQTDRDHERFSLKALGQLAELFKGKTVIMDHNWSSSKQTGRIFDGNVENVDGVNRLVLSAYMVRSAAAEPVITAIEGGILKEVSVGCAVKHAYCSICGTDKTTSCCPHHPGAEYDGNTCEIILDEAVDAYELSFVAVPAQPEAGVVKAYGGENNFSAEKTAEFERRKALALLELEEI